MRDSWSIILAVAETLLLAALLVLALWLLAQGLEAGGRPWPSWLTGLGERTADYGLTHLLLGVFFCGGAYWALQIFRRNRLAFWWVAVLSLIAHVPGIWSQNILEWQRFIGFDITFNLEKSPYLAGTQLLVCLALLVALRRVSDLRQLGSLMSAINVNEDERQRVLVNEGAALAGMVFIGLAASALMLGAGAALGPMEGVPDRIPMTIITVGGGACLLLIGATALFLRGLRREDGANSSGGGQAG